MSVCSFFCQHPSCWAAEQNLRRTIAHNAIKCNKSSQAPCKEHILTKNDIKISGKESLLPTYKFVNIGESDFPDECSFYNPSVLERDILDQKLQAAFTGKYLKKLHKRVKAVESTQSEKYHIKELHLEGYCLPENENSPKLVWVPGKKRKKKLLDEDRNEKRDVALTTIDGETIPTECLRNSQVIPRRILRSPTGGQPYNRSSRTPRDVIQTTYFDFLQMFSVGQPREFRRDVIVPSPLCTRTIPLLHFECTSKPSNDLPPITVSRPSQPRDRQTTRTKHPRRVLSLSRVSVSRKPMSRYPLTNHCTCSIKKTVMRDVIIEPLSSSEESSAVTSRICIRQQRSVSCGAMVTEKSSCLSVGLALPATSPRIGIKTKGREEMASPLCTCRLNMRTTNEEGFVSNQPSAVMSFRSSDEWTQDKELIRRTYDKYESLTPFKTPSQSRLCLPTENKGVIPSPFNCAKLLSVPSTACGEDDGKVDASTVLRPLVNSHNDVDEDDNARAEMHILNVTPVEKEWFGDGQALLRSRSEATASRYYEPDQISEDANFGEQNFDELISNVSSESPVIQHDARRIEDKACNEKRGFSDEEDLYPIKHSESSNSEQVNNCSREATANFRDSPVIEGASCDENVEVRSNESPANSYRAESTACEQENNPRESSHSSIKEEGALINAATPLVSPPMSALDQSSRNVSSPDELSLSSFTSSNEDMVSCKPEDTLAAVGQLLEMKESSYSFDEESVVDFIEGLDIAWNLNDELDIAIRGIEDMFHVDDFR